MSLLLDELISVFRISCSGANPYRSRRKCSNLLNFMMGEIPAAIYWLARNASLNTILLWGVGVKAGACRIEAV